MPATLADIDDFHRFAANEVRDASRSIEFNDLVRAWLRQRERDDVNAIIRQGMLDIAAGRGMPADEFNQLMREKYGLGPA